MINSVSAGIRKVLTKRRCVFNKNYVSGFDTEYNQMELGSNELLASTQSIYPRLFLQISKLNNINDIH